MPQNAIIKADGTGDYVTFNDWFVAEALSDYGEPTRCYIFGTVNAGANIIFNSASGNWPNNWQVRAFPGQEYNGANHTTCARITHTASALEFANIDADVQDIAVGVTGGYNVEPIKISNGVSATARRKITLKRLYLESSPFYHGSSYTAEFNTATPASGAGSQYELDFEDIVIYSRASNRGIYISGRADNNSFIGTVKRITVLPTNSGSNATNGFWLGGGNDSNVVFDKILSLFSEIRSNVTDYQYDGLGGTRSNISTRDGSGTVTGVTTATELENYAAGDYRLKSTGSGNGAFPQAAAPGYTGELIKSDLAVSDKALTVQAGVNLNLIKSEIQITGKLLDFVTSQTINLIKSDLTIEGKILNIETGYIESLNKSDLSVLSKSLIIQTGYNGDLLKSNIIVNGKQVEISAGYSSDLIKSELQVIPKTLEFESADEINLSKSQLLIVGKQLDIQIGYNAELIKSSLNIEAKNLVIETTTVINIEKSALNVVAKQLEFYTEDVINLQKSNLFVIEKQLELITGQNIDLNYSVLSVNAKLLSFGYVAISLPADRIFTVPVNSSKFTTPVNKKVFTLN